MKRIIQRMLPWTGWGLAIAACVWAASERRASSALTSPTVPPSAVAPGKLRGAPTPTPPMWIQGPILRAASVAVSDLLAATQGETASPKASELQRCLGRMESYDVRIHETPERYALYVRPSIERCIKDDPGSLRGGDAEYEISKLDFSIASRSF